MAFENKSGDLAENNKQHLNLSESAYEVILSDMFTFSSDRMSFKEKNLSGFINRVFENFYRKAEASISLTLNNLKGKYSMLLSGVPVDEKSRKRLIDKLISQEEARLINKNSSYENGISFKFWLQKSNLEFLSEPNSECNEDKYYSSRGKYIKCVLEEYSRLPYIERELIYYSRTVEDIQYAIEEGKQLRIVTSWNSVFSVYPYKILCDPFSTANYLVGYSTRYDEPDAEKTPCSFKIATLNSVRVEKSKSAYLKESAWKHLSELIKVRGVQFMIGNETTIRVRLTDDGIYKYHRQSLLRPQLVELCEGNEFVFKCTEAQAEFYFFKFGKDAEILEPEELRNKLANMYDEALRMYMKNKQDEREVI